VPIRVDHHSCCCLFCTTSSHIATNLYLVLCVRSSSILRAFHVRRMLLTQTVHCSSNASDPHTISRTSHNHAYKSPLNRFDLKPGFSLDGRFLVLMKKPNLASAILGVGVLILDDRRIGVACSLISRSSGWLVIALFFVAGFALAVIFLLAFAVTALFCSGETIGVVFLGGARTGYLALNACTMSVAESSETARSEN
jgi:hypothetical protein